MFKYLLWGQSLAEKVCLFIIHKYVYYYDSNQCNYAYLLTKQTICHLHTIFSCSFDFCIPGLSLVIKIS